MSDQTKPVDISFELDREQIAARRPCTVRLAVRVRAADVPVDRRRPPLSVVLALDVSASMAGVPLQQVVRSAERIAAVLRAEDRLGVVAFSDHAFDVAPVRVASEPMRRELSRALGALRVISQTNVESGLHAAQRMLHDRPTQERRVVLLLSDGQPNVGACSPVELARIAQSSEVTTATLGYGPHHDDRVLGAIADGGRGCYAFVADPELCQLEIARAIGSQGDVVVERLEARIAALEGARLVSVVGHDVRAAGEEAVVDLPDLCAGARAVVAAHFAMEARDGGARRAVADVAVSFRAAGGGPPGCVSRRLEIAAGSSDSPERPDVVRAVLLAEAAQRRREACGLADRGRFDDAAVILREVVARVRAAPGLTEDADLAEALEQLVDDAELMSRRPDELAYAAFRRGQRDNEAAIGARSAESRAMLDDAAGDVPHAELVVVEGPLRNAAFRLRPENLIGRTTYADICLPDGSVSRRHARITAANGAFWVVDLGSTNTTHVNGRPIRKHELTDGDELELGSWRLRFTAREEPL